MGKTINELWHGNIVPQEDSRTNSKAMKELMGYIARHSEDLGKLERVRESCRSSHLRVCFQTWSKVNTRSLD